MRTLFTATIPNSSDISDELVTLHLFADLLLEMELEMRRLGLWESEPPTREALSSQLPFCRDTLRFEQWLQWVLLPKMREIVQSNSGWPRQSEIYDLAMERFGQLHLDSERLAYHIGTFDALIAEQALDQSAAGFARCVA